MIFQIVKITYDEDFSENSVKYYEKEYNLDFSITGYKKVIELINNNFEGWYSVKYEDETLSISFYEFAGIKDEEMKEIKNLVENSLYKYFEKDSHLSSEVINNELLLIGQGIGIDEKLENYIVAEGIETIDRKHSTDEVGASGGSFEILIQLYEISKHIKELLEMAQVIIVPVKWINKDKKIKKYSPELAVAYKEICENERIFDTNLKVKCYSYDEDRNLFITTIENEITKDQYKLSIESREVTSYEKMKNE